MKNLWDEDLTEYVNSVFASFNSKAKEPKKQNAKKDSISFLEKKKSSLKIKDFNFLAEFENNVLYYERAIERIQKK